MVLKNITEQAKRECKHLAGAFIDIAKSFDSIFMSTLQRYRDSEGLASISLELSRTSTGLATPHFGCGGRRFDHEFGKPQLWLFPKGKKLTDLRFADDLLL